MYFILHFVLTVTNFDSSIKCNNVTADLPNVPCNACLTQNNFIMLVYCSYCVYNLSASVKLITLPCYLLHPVRQLVRHRLSVVMYSVMNVFVCEVDVL